ncbi:MAG: methylmalonyl-CoA mutase [Euryarchaeota archaeon]|jgi:methylmalonyl-CoA mutase N-terminal domain/subunit|nr:methylmalonyl-CoA mutase [Euryarchaeota archaeon]MDP6363699.1 methylmalonyl-CoA mutase family protein [Candidatus Poseidoniia archaeon]MDP6658399.1 methylmalonyl-CoA mutase family protein [Candidatus Poseidoniia archaeon]MDP6846068.1 methylmalonyl-CoA mutase family protein [Candidatus Poseidoniia archaeon]MDP7006832.1 methylmalonyl-CoA mutase family protein [Candidatus Poseidoniia archaeon]|tara:strand:+ start:2920 stop:4635 length:1716 start_codon:yes stop_codon:yes gene_type:complete
MTPPSRAAAGSGGGEKSRPGDLEAERARWERETLAPALERHPERRPRFITTSGQEVGRLYTALDTAHLDYDRDIGFPGEYPYTRGIHATMHRGRLWTMRMFAGFGSARETNARFKYLLSQGQTGLSTAFDLPTLYGYDSDSPTAAGEFGECGVGVSSLEDMAQLFDGIPLDKVTTSMTINSPAAIIWAMYIANAENNGVPRAKLGGTIQNDILKEFIAQKEYLYPPLPSLRLVTDTVEFGTREMPKWNTISISGYHIREAGSTAAQELAFTLADGFAYVDDAVARGLGVDEFAPRLSFFFNAHNDFFEEIAKYRAARRIWAREMREKYGAQDPRSWKLRFHTQTAGCSLTAQQPEVNIVRVAIQALAGVMGGTQSLHTDAMDEALALPSEKAAQIALRTQQVIAHESGAANVVDPLGGSYYLEWLTDDLERQARDYFDRIDSLGGVIPAIEKGWFQKEIAAAAYAYQREIDSGERKVVGVNAHTVDEPIEIPILEIDPKGFERQCARLARLRKRRDPRKHEAALDAVRKAAEGDDNLMPHFITAVRADATLGELCEVLRGVFGEYREPSEF